MCIVLEFAAHLAFASLMDSAAHLDSASLRLGRVLRTMKSAKIICLRASSTHLLLSVFALLMANTQKNLYPNCCRDRGRKFVVPPLIPASLTRYRSLRNNTRNTLYRAHPSYPTGHTSFGQQLGDVFTQRYLYPRTYRILSERPI